MDLQIARKAIYKQAKHLRRVYNLPIDCNVHIYWQGSSPLVLPYPTPSYGVGTTIKLESILNKTCILI